MRRKILKAFILSILSSFIVLIMWGCKLNEKSKDTIIDMIESEIEVVIPDEFEIKEQYRSNIFMHGRLPSYYIFKTYSEPTTFLSDYAFEKNDNKKVEEDIINTLLEENIAFNLKIPESSLIDFSCDYLLFYKKDNFYLIYLVNSYELVVYIEGN